MRISSGGRCRISWLGTEVTDLVALKYTMLQEAH